MRLCPHALISLVVWLLLPAATAIPPLTPFARSMIPENLVFNQFVVQAHKALAMKQAHQAEMAGFMVAAVGVNIFAMEATYSWHRLYGLPSPMGSMLSMVKKLFGHKVGDKIRA